MSQNKSSAIAFLKHAASGEVRLAYENFVSKNMKHHNVHFKGDAHSLMVAMEENAKTHPNKSFEIQHSVEEGDIVAVHSKVQLEADEKEIAVVHIFRFEDGKIVEMWDIGQLKPEDSPNENGMF